MKAIVAAPYGWVFVGEVTRNDAGGIDMVDAKNIRRWGTTKGLGELVNGPTKETVIDPYGDITIDNPVFSLKVKGGW
jgi:hypothetical protein